MYQEIIEQIQSDKQLLLTDITKLETIQKELEGMGLYNNASDLTQPLRAKQKRYNELCDDIESYRQATRQEASFKAQATKINKQAEAEFKGIEELHKLTKAGFSYDPVCPYTQKYLIKAWEKGFHTDGFIPYKKQA